MRLGQPINSYKYRQYFRLSIDSPKAAGYIQYMNTSIFSQAIGLLACAGVMGLMVLVALVSLSTGMRRGRKTSVNNPIIQPPSAPPFEEDDFGGVPTTGPVQEYERDYHSDVKIGSSGFDAQSYDYDHEPDEES